MVKILITTIRVNFCAASQNLPELSLLKFLPLTYHHSHFLAATLDFTSFFTIAFLRAAHFFTAWLFWIRYIYIYIYSSTAQWEIPTLAWYNNYFVFNAKVGISH